MLTNYLKVARRNLSRNRGFSAINIVGLALSMAGSLLIGLWINDELSVGRQYANASNLYRVYERQVQDGKISASNGTPGLLPDELKQHFPEVVYAAGLNWDEPHLVSVNEKATKQIGRYAGADWFRIYDISLLAGTAMTALKAPNSIAISHQMATHFFGSADKAIGKLVRLDNQLSSSYQVTAVFDDLPANAEDKYDFLLSWSDFLARNEWAKEWGTNSPQTRILLQPGTDPTAFEAKIRSLLKERNKGIGPNFDIQLFLQPEVDAYLYSDLSSGYADGGRIDYVRLFSIIAGFLLLIACINFMNLATARSVKRAKEVGIRKVVGAERSWLIGQFLGEALLLTLLALVLTFALAWLLLPAFNELTDKQMVIPISRVPFWLIIVGLWLVVGLVAGSYPALFLSSLQPIRVLKSALRFGAGAVAFRRGLVIFQFSTSMVLIVGTVVVYRQLAYMQNKHLGYERENLIYVLAEGRVATNYETFKQELLRSPNIQSITRMNDRLTDFGNSTNSVSWPGKAANQGTEFQVQSAGYDVVKTLKLTLRGRDFSPRFGTDSTNYLINETAAKRLGYTDPIGKSLTLWNRPGTIIGVLQDFHYGSLHKAIEPIIIRLNKDVSFQTVMIRTKPGQTKTALAQLETIYKQINPGFPFSYQFADTAYEKLYRSEAVISTLVNVFASLAIFIACLGLLGLSAFTAEQRNKEIGIRKVLGASVTAIVALLSVDFLKLVLLAIVVAIPLSWYLMSGWLQRFAYRLELSWWVFGVAGLLAMLIALLTVSVQSIKAALLDPVKSLKSE